MARRSNQHVRKGEPFSVRFTLAADKTVAEEARRTRRSKSAVVEALAEEAIRTRRFAGIAFRGDDAGRRPWVIGSGLDVWEVCQIADELGGLEQVIEETQVEERGVRLALAYRDAYREEVDEQIAENRRPAQEWAELYPFVRFNPVT